MANTNPQKKKRMRKNKVNTNPPSSSSLKLASDSTQPPADQMFATEHYQYHQPQSQSSSVFGDYGALVDRSFAQFPPSTSSRADPCWSDRPLNMVNHASFWMPDPNHIDSNLHNPATAYYDHHHPFLSDSAIFPALSQETQKSDSVDFAEWRSRSTDLSEVGNDDEDTAHRPSPPKRPKLESVSSSREAMSPLTDADGDVLPDDGDKREKFLARNRVAASRCRLKKKAWQSDLEDKARRLSVEKDYLTSVVTELRNELIELKCRCLEHTNCSCNGIRQYLKRAVAMAKPASELYSSVDRKLSDASLGSSEVGCVSPASLSRLDEFSPSMISPTDGPDSGSSTLDYYTYHHET